MAQVTTGEISFLVSVLMTAELSVIGFFMKGLINEIKGQLTGISNDLGKLKVEIPQRYMTKHDCEIMISRCVNHGRRNDA